MNADKERREGGPVSRNIYIVHDTEAKGWAVCDGETILEDGPLETFRVFENAEAYAAQAKCEDREEVNAMSYYKEIPPEIDITSEETLAEFTKKAEETPTFPSLGLMVATLFVGFQWLYKEAVEVCSFHGLDLSLLRLYLYERWSGDKKRFFVYLNGETNRIYRGFTLLRDGQRDDFGQSYLISPLDPGKDVHSFKVPQTIKLQEKFPKTYDTLCRHYIIPCARWVYSRLSVQHEESGIAYGPDEARQSYNRLSRCHHCKTLRSQDNLFDVPIENVVRRICAVCLSHYGLFRCKKCYEAKPLGDKRKRPLHAVNGIFVKTPKDPYGAFICVSCDETERREAHL